MIDGPAETRYILELLGPTLEQTSRYCVAIQGGRVAVVVLDEPGHVDRDELVLALRLHDRLGGRLLVVL